MDLKFLIVLTVIGLVLLAETTEARGDRRGRGRGRFGGRGGDSSSEESSSQESSEESSSEESSEEETTDVTEAPEDPVEETTIDLNSALLGRRKRSPRGRGRGLGRFGRRGGDSSSEESSSEESSSQESSEEEDPEATTPDVPVEETTVSGTVSERLSGLGRRKRSPRRRGLLGRQEGFQERKEQLESECLANNTEVGDAARCVMEAIAGKFCVEKTARVPKFQFGNRMQQRMRAKAAEKACATFGEEEQTDECEGCFQNIADPMTKDGFDGVKACGEQYLGEAYTACADEFDIEIEDGETVDKCTLRPALSCMALQKCEDAPSSLPAEATDEDKLDSILLCMKALGPHGGRRGPGARRG